MMVLNIDAPLTLLDIAGLAAAATMQGRSFLPRARLPIEDDWLYECYEVDAACIQADRGLQGGQARWLRAMTNAAPSAVEWQNGTRAQR